MSHTPHDALFKAVFSEPSRAMAEVRAVFPPEVTRHFDLDSAELVSGSFVDESLRERMADLLFRLRASGREAFAYLLFEHQSEPDALMVFRMLRYMVRIWERWLAENPEARTLPVILPLVLSHGPQGWTAASTLGELYDADPEALADLARWLPGYELPVDDLLAQTDAALRDRAADALGRLVVLSLKHSRTGEDLAALVVSWHELVREVVDAPSGVEAFRLVLNYVLQVRDVDEEEFGRLLELKAGPKTKEAFVTTAERLIEKGRQEGRQEGREEGREEGRHEGMQSLLLRLLSARFGPLTPEVVARVDAAEAASLELWSERVLSASSIEAVFAE